MGVLLDRAIGQVVSGEAVDWETLRSGAPDDQERAALDDLRELAALADVPPPDCAAADHTVGTPEPRGVPWTRWGHLELFEELGRGAHGAVYRAWDTRLARSVAVKLLVSAAVTAGNYFVRTRNSAGFIDQVHDTGANVVCAGCDATLTGTPVAVAAGSVVTGIDFAMQEGGRISGTVIGPGGTPVQNAQVLVFADPSAPVALFAASGTTDRLGRYVVGSGLPAGSYYARTSNSLGLVNTRYAGMPCTSECSLTLASPIAVNTGIVTSGIDFVLTADDDADQEGIASSLDTSTAASNAFSDLTQGGSTSGVITDRAGWSVNVTAAGSSGVKAALAGTGTGPAILQTCATNSAEEVRLLAAGDAATIQCSNDSEGRTSVRVVAAASFVELRKTINGLTTVIELATGQVASIGSPVVADGGNLSSIRVRIEDASGLTIGEFSLDPGESAAADKAAGGLVSVTVLTGTVDVTLQGTEQTLRPGDVASVAACARIAIESISATPAILGPANHKMVSVKVYPILSGTCGRASWEIVSVTSNEPVDGLGDGDTSPDWEIGPDRTLFLRAERSGAGTGRTYTVTVRATDESGNVALKSVTVTVKK